MNKQRLQQNQKLKLSPKQIQFLGILQIPLSSLESRIEEELEKNPALEEEIAEEEDATDLQTEQSYFKKSNPDYNPLPIPEKEETLYDALLKQLLLLNLDEKEYSVKIRTRGDTSTLYASTFLNNLNGLDPVTSNLKDSSYFPFEPEI